MLMAASLRLARARDSGSIPVQAMWVLVFTFLFCRRLEADVVGSSIGYVSAIRI